MRACSVGLIAALLAACGEAQVVFLPADDLASVVLVEGDRVEAFDVRAGPVRRGLPAEPLFVVGYQASLEALGLRPGLLALDAGGDPLPAGDRYHRLVDDAAWEEVPAAPAAVEAVRVAPRDTCARFTLVRESIALAPHEILTFVVELDAASVLFATDAGRFFRVTGDGLPQPVALATTTPSLAAFRAPDGELWLAGRGGRLVRGDLTRGFDEAPPIPLDTRVGLVLEGSRAGAPFELFAADGARAVAHFDGTTWRRVFEGTGRQRLELRTRIAWAEPGLAVLIGVGTSSVVEVRQDGVTRRIRLELPPRSSIEGPWQLTHVAGRGVVLGTHYDVLLVRENGGFTRMGEPPITPRADVMVDLGGGALLAGGQEGNFVELRARDDFCEPLRLRTGSFTHGAARLGTGLVYLAREMPPLAGTSSVSAAEVVTAARLPPRS